MAHYPVEIYVLGRLVRTYQQVDGSISVWIDDGNHGFSQVPGLLPYQPASVAQEALYVVAGRAPGNSEIGTERNMLEMLVRDYLRVTGQRLEVV